MPGFKKLSCDWSEPCFAEYLVEEQWSGNCFRLPFDVFSRRPAEEDADRMISEVERLVRDAHVDAPWQEYYPGLRALRASMVDALVETRAALDLACRPFAKATLAKVLDQGPQNVALYFAAIRDSDGFAQIRLRAHTLRYVSAPRLWFEHRLPSMLREERMLAAARELLAKLPRRFDREVWLSKVREFSDWAFKVTCPADPDASWSERKAVSFVIGAAGDRWASVFARDELRDIRRQGDWVTVTTKPEKRDYGRIVLKCAPTAAARVEQDLVNGSRLQFEEGKDILGLAEFWAIGEEDVPWSGTLSVWKLAVADVCAFAPVSGAVCEPEKVFTDGRRNYGIYTPDPTPSVFVHPELVEPGELRLIAIHEGSALIYPFREWDAVKIRLPLLDGAENSVTATRRRVRVDGRSQTATVVQRIAVDRKQKEVDVFLKAIECDRVYARQFSRVEARGAFGDCWSSLDVLEMHLAVYNIVKRAAFVIQDVGPILS